jgi:glutathione synthase/RimK-type ligase-like ATP-grasp enzyme
MMPTRLALIINGSSLLPEQDEFSPILTDGVDVVFRSVNELAFTIDAGGVRIYETVSGRDIADFGVVQIMEYPRPTATLLTAIADYLQTRNVLAINVAGIGAPTKLFQYVRLAQAGLSVPMTAYRSPELLASSYDELAQKFGLPFILKSMSASGGRSNYLVSHEDDLINHLQSHPRANRFLVQEFIPNDTTIRFLVFGGQASIAMQLTGTESLYQTNMVQSGRTILLSPDDFDPVAKKLAVRAASLTGFEVAGIKLMQNWTTGRWYVLNVDSNPALGTGAFVSQKLHAYSAYLKRVLAAPSNADVTR